MDLIKRKGEKVGPIKDILHKCKYTCQGYAYCFKNETSFTIEAICMALAVILGIIFNIKPYEWLFSLVSLLLIMEIEFLNTGIEATVDMVTEKFHPLAKIAKDCGSAATGTATLVAIIVHLYIYVPIIWALIVK